VKRLPNILIFALVPFLAVAIACTRLPKPQDKREELKSIPGAADYPEGYSDHPDLILQAKEKLERHDIAGAEELYKKVVALEPENAPGYVGLASCRLLQNDLDGAENNYRQALVLDQSSTMAAIGLGTVAYTRGKYQEAAEYYLKALNIDERNADAHWGAGLALDAAGKGKEAAGHYRRFVELAPDSGQAGLARERIAQLEAAGK
jgi:tetratricopeptide (TPR) repeat protein